MIDNVFKLAQIQAQKAGHKKWLQLRRMALDYYDGLTQDYTKAYYTAKTLQWVSVANNNITKRIINRVSLVYMVPPVRKIRGEDNDNYKNITPTKDFKLQRLERWVNLLGLEAVRPVWDAAKQVFDYYLITDFSVETDPNDPLTPISITYPIQVSSGLLDTTPTVYERLTAFGSQRLDEKGNVISSEDFYYDGKLPVLFVFRDGIPETQFVDVYPALDLIETNTGVNIMLTDTRMNQRFQGHGKFYAKGIQDPNVSISLSPQAVSIFPEVDASLEVVSPPDMTGSAVSAIQNEYKMLALNYGLDPSFVEGTAPQSGVALKIRNLELTDKRKADVTRWREFEQDLFNLEQSILRIESPKFAARTAGEFSVDFTEATNVLTEDEQQKRDDWDLAHNLITAADVLKRRNPDIENPEAVIEANREKNTGSPSVGSLLGAE